MDTKDKDLTKRELAEFESAELAEKEIMSLENHPGWRELVKELQQEVEALDEQILDISTPIEPQELEHLRIRRHYLNALVNYPRDKRQMYNARQEFNPQEAPGDDIFN